MERCVFVTLSNKDKRFLNEMLDYLFSHFEEDAIDIWDETRMQQEAEWASEFEKCLNEALAAVVLISPNYLISHYNHLEHLYRLLREAESNAVIVRCIAISDSSYDLFDFNDFVFLTDYNTELIKLKEEDRKALWAKLLDELEYQKWLWGIDIPEESKLKQIIQDKHPNWGPQEVEAAYHELLGETADHYRKGERLVEFNIDKKGKPQITEIDIDGIDT